MSTDLKAKFAAIAPVAGLQVDAEKGIIKDVALVSIGDAAGHGLRVDMQTLKDFYALVSGKTVKAFINHEEDPKPTEAIGLYSGFYIDAESGILRAAQFQAFKAFRENNKAEYDTLFEMAANAPEAFGISASFFYKIEDATDGGSPFTRPTHVESFDIVCTPAANKALFSRDHKIIETESQVMLDASNKSATQEKQIETHSQKTAKPKSQFSTVKTVFAHFSKRPAALPLIAQFSAEMPEDTKPEDIISKVELALGEQEQAALIAERDALKAENEILKAKVEELAPKVEVEAEMGKKLTELEAKFSASEAENAQLKKLTARFGVKPINTGAPAKDEVKPLTRAEWSKLSPAEQGAHFQKGGKLTE